MSKKVKKLRKKLHEVSVSRLSLYDIADTVKTNMSVAKYLIATKYYGSRIGMLDENGIVACDDIACDILDECFRLLSAAQSDE